MAVYQYITFAQLQAELLQRLQDVSGSFTTPAEAGVYLTEALRVFNAQTATWNDDYLLDFSPATHETPQRRLLPRQRTITNIDIFTELEYMLMEPPSGGVWTGTNQFNLTNLAGSLQARRDELLQASAANVVNITNLNSPVSGTTTQLPIRRLSFDA